MRHITVQQWFIPWPMSVPIEGASCGGFTLLDYIYIGKEGIKKNGTLMYGSCPTKQEGLARTRHNGGFIRHITVHGVPWPMSAVDTRCSLWQICPICHNMPASGAQQPPVHRFMANAHESKIGSPQNGTPVVMFAKSRYSSGCLGQRASLKEGDFPVADVPYIYMQASGAQKKKKVHRGKVNAQERNQEKKIKKRIRIYEVFIYIIYLARNRVTKYVQAVRAGYSPLCACFCFFCWCLCFCSSSS